MAVGGVVAMTWCRSHLHPDTVVMGDRHGYVLIHDHAFTDASHTHPALGLGRMEEL